VRSRERVDARRRGDLVAEGIAADIQSWMCRGHAGDRRVRYGRGVSEPRPICPTCGQPGSRSLGPGEGWECRNEACPEFGQALAAEEPPRRDEPTRPDAAR